MFRRYLNLVFFILPAFLWIIAGFFVFADAANSPPPASNYAPNLWFDSREQYFPTNPLDFYYENGQEISGEIAVSKYNQLSVQDKINNLTVLYHIEDEGNQWVYQYWFFYVFNDNHRGVKNKHYGDWESVFVFVDKSSGGINKVIGTAHQREIFNTEIYNPETNHIWTYIGEGSHASCVDNINDGSCNFLKWIKFETWDKKGSQLLHDNYNLVEINSNFVNNFRGVATLKKSSVLGINLFDLVEVKKFEDKELYIPWGGKPPKHAWEQSNYYNPEELRPYSMRYAADYISNKFNQAKTQVASSWDNLVSGVSNIFKKSDQSAGISSSLLSLELLSEVEPPTVSELELIVAPAPIPAEALAELSEVQPPIVSELVVESGMKELAKEEEETEEESEVEPPIVEEKTIVSYSSSGSSSADASQENGDESTDETATSTEEIATSTEEIIEETDTNSPMAVIDLNASAGNSRGTISLSWTAPGDDESVGTSTEYIIKYATSTIASSTWDSAIDISGEPAPLVASSSESMTISDLEINQTYYFALKSKDESDNLSEISNITNASPSALGDSVIISEIQLGTREFVELYNPTSQTINMTGWYWSYYSPNRNWDDPYRNLEFPEEASIPADGYYLIGLGSGTGGWYDMEFDWRPYETSQLNNSVGSIAIFPWDPSATTSAAAENSAIDALGWGSIDYVYKDTSVSAPSLEKSLVRQIAGWDTDNNSNDFIEKDWPNPKNSSGESLTIVMEGTEVTENSTWDLSGSPYILESNETNQPIIRSGATLTIEPGVTIKGISKYYSSLVIEGVLKAEGTNASPITFTGNNASSSPGDWLGIEFDSADNGSVLDYVNFEYGGYWQVFQGSEEMVRILNSSVTITNSNFENSFKNGIYLYNSDSSISDSSFSSAEKDIVISGSESQPTINNCQFSGSIGIKAYNHSSLTVNNSSFSGGNYPITISSAYPSLSGNQSDSAKLNGVYIEPESVFNQDMTWKADLPYVLYSGSNTYPTVASGTVLTIEPGVVIKPVSDYYHGLFIEGELIAQGTTSTPIVFTSLKDDDYGGDTNADNASTTPAVGDWKNIKFFTGSRGELNHILFRYGSAQPLQLISPDVILGDNIKYEP